MGLFASIGKTIDKMNERIAKAASWLAIVLVLTMAFEVVARYVFNRPTVWSYDLSYFINSLLVMMGLAYTHKLQGHVSIDVISSRFSVRVQSIINVILTLLFFFPICILVIRAMVPNVVFSFTSGERSWVGSWLPPIWPFKLWILIGFVLLLLQGVVEFVRNLLIAIKGEQ